MSVSCNHCSSSSGPRVNTLPCDEGAAKLRLCSSYAVIGRHGADRGRDLDGIVVDVLDRVGGAQISTFFERALQMRDIACLQLEGAIKKCSPQVLRASDVAATSRMHLHALALLPLHRVIAQLTPATVQTSAN